MTTDVSQIRGLLDIANPRVQQEVAQVCALIQRSFPEARFLVGPHPSHRGAIVDTYTAATDDFQLLDLVNDRLLDLLIEEDIAIQVIPLDLTWFPETD
jgi:hypothetical protein